MIGGEHATMPRLANSERNTWGAPIFIAASLFVSLFLGGCGHNAGILSGPTRMVVSAPVANLRADPTPHSGAYEYDSLQLTQLEEGEPVVVLERRGEWARVEVPEQEEFTQHNRWGGYQGWVRYADLSADMRLYHHITRDNAPEAELRKSVLAQASRHLGTPYLWGGKSLHDSVNQDIATGVDCSGLVHWSFRQLGIFIPRDSHEQYLRAKPVPPEKLAPGDLVFSAKPKNPERIVHVAFYMGDDQLLEAPSSGEKVRKISGLKKLGKPIREIKSGEQSGDRIIYFGTFFMGEQ